MVIKFLPSIVMLCAISVSYGHSYATTENEETSTQVLPSDVPPKYAGPLDSPIGRRSFDSETIQMGNEYMNIIKKKPLLQEIPKIEMTTQPDIVSNKVQDLVISLNTAADHLMTFRVLPVCLLPIISFLI